MLFIEIGNSTLKVARPSDAGEFIVERMNDPGELARYISDASGTIVVIPVAEEKSLAVLPLLSDKPDLRILGRSDFTSFIGDSYDTPETLGLDRILNLFALNGDGIVISCGTAITIDAIADGYPCWGAIMPGFTTATEGLARSAPSLPTVSFDDLGDMPARTSRESVANGVILGTALAAFQLASFLAERCAIPPDAPVIFTGGDADEMGGLFRSERPVEIRPALLFEGAKRQAGD